MAPSTGLLRAFDIVLFEHGMVLQFPTQDSPEGVLPFRADPGLGNVFFDYAHWLKVLNLNYLSSLHQRVTNGKVQELILISEAFHSQRLSRIAEDIVSRPSIKVWYAFNYGEGTKGAIFIMPFKDDLFFITN